MNTNTYEKLEFNEIRTEISQLAKSEEAKEKLITLEPYLNPHALRTALEETDDGRKLAEHGFRVPVHSLNGVKGAMKQLEKESVLTPAALQDLGEFLQHCGRMKKFMEEKKFMLCRIGDYAVGIESLEELSEDILRSVQGGQVTDQASSRLSKVRKSIRRMEERIRERMQRFLSSDQLSGQLQDDRYRIIDGKFVLPVKRSSKNVVDGQVIGHSNKGTTAFVQPEAVLKYQNELESLRADEKTEEYRILSELTNEVACHSHEVHQNMDIMIQYDIVLAKGRHSRKVDGQRVKWNTQGIIELKKARHPLLGQEAVPLDIEVGKTYRSLVITGPNTGGKTVALKTTGLLSLMAQSGLHIPCEAGSTLPMYEDILVDIGDNQNLEQSLSTFSAHIKNIIGIVKYARKSTLVILDEIGTGTDPVEGTGLGISILEKLHEQGATVLATTHFTEIKGFASKHEGFQTGSMAFDVDSLRPLYRLDIGKPGKSNAFLIALRLGLDYNLINRAHEASYGERKSYKEIADKFKKSSLEVHSKVADGISEPVKNIGSERRKNEAKQVRKQLKRSEKALEESKFAVGDAVKITGLPATAIVAEGPDRKGNYIVNYSGKKISILGTRMKLYIDKDLLYPEAYDMDIVTKSKTRRKKEKALSKGKRDVVLEGHE